MVLALALAISFAFARARADEPPPGDSRTYALNPDSVADVSGPLASAAPVAASEAASSTPAAAAVPASTAPRTAPPTAPPPPSAKSATSKAAAPKAGPSQADEGARARQSVDRTEAVLRYVNAKVTRSFNRNAREEFGKALSLQREAREALGQNLFARADRLTQESRGLAREIAVHLGPPQDDPDYVDMMLGRTDDAVGRAKEVLRGSGGDDERGRLEALERRQKEARRLLKEGSTREAYAATRNVRDGVLTLLRDCDDLPVPAETAERALKRATRAMEQLKGELGERPTREAEKLSRDARSQMEKARGAYSHKNYRDTLLYSKLVERDLELAVSAQRVATSRNG